MGIDRMHEFFTRFGLGKKTGIDLPGEVSGLVPSRTWKRAAKNQPWYPGETLIAGIGQGYMLATPLQLAQLAATLSRRGAQVRPHLWRDAGPEPLEPLPLRREEYWDAALKGMENVVNAKYGTAKSIKDAPYRIAGKTGTAQVFTIKQHESYDAKKLDRRLHDHAVFIGYAPAEAPRIAVAAFVEHGGSGSGVAAPIVRKVMDGWLLEDYVQQAAVVQEQAGSE